MGAEGESMAKLAKREVRMHDEASTNESDESLFTTRKSHQGRLLHEYLAGRSSKRNPWEVLVYVGWRED